MEGFWLRQARPEERIELTRLCVRATRHLGYDDAFIERIAPTLAIAPRSIADGNVLVCEREPRSVVGVVSIESTIVEAPMAIGSDRARMTGIAMLGGIFVEPSLWRGGIGRLLFGAAVVRARERKVGALMIHAEPSAEGFYLRLGAFRVGEAPYINSPEVVLPHLLYIVPRQA
jgi:GNAT superfamily N-acetyltransferase